MSDEFWLPISPVHPVNPSIRKPFLLRQGRDLQLYRCKSQIVMKYLSFFLIVALPGLVSAQVTISGTITDSRGEPVPGANIILESTYDGASSDSEGRFSFTTEETGDHNLTIRFVGYRPVNKPISIGKESVRITVALKEEINELEAVTITAGSFTAGDESRRTVFRPLDIATTAGATADIAGALNTLPGTQKVGETGRLFVRGGDGSETRTFIDGLVVHEAYGAAAPNTPSRGRFLPFMFKGTSFSTGGYSAEFGQALSSALVLDSKDEAGITRTDFGLLSVGADVTHTQAWGTGSVAGKLQYTNIRPYFRLIRQDIDWITPPASVEGVASFRQKVGDKGMVKLYGNFNTASFSLFQHDIDDPDQRSRYELQNDYRYVNGSCKTELNDEWVLRGGFSYTTVRDNIGLHFGTINRTERAVHAKGVVEGSLAHGVENKTGIEVLQRTFNEEVAVADHGFEEWIPAAFTETDIYIGNRFVTRLGARVEYNSLNESAGLDPRASLAFKTGKSGQISFAYGTFRQTPHNDFLKLDHALESEKAEHFILNFQRIENNRTLRIEGYYKQYKDLLKIDSDGGFSNTGDGYARGIEFFWRDNRSIRRLDYWASYSFLDTRRDYLNFPTEATPSFASTHNFSLVAKYFITSMKSQASATYSYASGRPYNNPNEDRFNGSRTPAYHDLSISWSYLPRPNIIVFLSCTNVTGRDNIFGYEYGSTPNEGGLYNGRPIRQAAPRFMFIGLFLTLSKDKSVNQLPSL